MGRRPTKTGSVPRLRERKRGVKIHYYYDLGGKPRKELPLGSDYGAAIMKYAELERDRSASDLVKAVITFEYVATRYRSTSSQRKRPAPSATT